MLDLQVNLRSIALTKKMSRIFNCPSERWNKDSLARGYLVFKARVRGRSISKKNGSFIPKYQTMLFSLQNLFAKMKMNHSIFQIPIQNFVLRKQISITLEN